MIVELLVATFCPFVLYILFDFARQLLRMREFPPGPIPYPIFGNLHLFQRSPHVNFGRLKEKYGDVCSFSLPSQRVVLINNIDIARDVLLGQGEKVTGRWLDNLMADIITKRKDLITAEGERWKRLRKMTHAGLQMYGYGIERLQTMIVTESEHFRDKMLKLKGKPIDPRLYFVLFFTNVTCAVMFGKRYEEDDSEFHQMKKFHEYLIQAMSINDATCFLPWLRYLPFFESINMAKKAIAIRDPLFLQKIKEHKDTYDPDHLRDFTDSLIKYTTEQNKSVDNAVEEDIVMLLHDFVFAGVDTGLNSIGFGMLYLVHHPEYQDMIAEELRQILGETTYPTIQDRPRLPILHATVMEILRHSSVTLLGLVHRCLEPIKIRDYTLTKDTLFFYNVWSMNHDERYWENPHEFNPKRWLNEDGSVKLGGKESFISFGLGRRNCVGETLAKAELFIFLGRILKDFKLLPEEDQTLPSLEPELTFLLTPQPCKMRFIARDM